MNLVRLSSLVVVAICLIVATPAIPQDKTVNQAIDESLGDHTKYEAVITALQKAVAAHDAKGVAALVQYPIGVKVKGKETHIKSAKTFAENYDGIITPAMAKVITDQKYEDLFVNYKGVMFGNGEVWLNGICRDNACKNFDVKVVTIQDGPKQ